MRYLGGKSKLSKRFAPIILDALSRGGCFYEPFVGGFNVVQHLNGAPSVCNDIHPGLICMYRAIANEGWMPPSRLTETEYKELKKINDHKNPLTAFAAFGCSFSGKEWGGFAKSSDRDHTKESYRNIARKAKHISKCTWMCGDYSCFSSDVIYCDPPYRGTTGYRYCDFDSEKFNDWCHEMHRHGCRVFVSEFSNPRGWKVVWEVDRKVTVRIDGNYSSKKEMLLEVS